MRDAPIGLFDSGVGGLTVLRAVARRLPREHTVYLGDTARVPYGTRSREVVTRYALLNARHLSHRLAVKEQHCRSSSRHAAESDRKLPGSRRAARTGRRHCGRHELLGRRGNRRRDRGPVELRDGVAERLEFGQCSALR